MACPFHYPDRLPIEPLARAPKSTLAPPGSKSITNRALVLGALASAAKPTLLHGCLRSEDTEVMLAALGRLGYEAEPDWGGPRQTVRVFRGDRPLVPARSAELYVANSGTTMRFLTALVSLGQ